MAYEHGIYIQEEATALTPMTQVESPSVVIGTALKGRINQPVLIQNMSDFITEFGFADDFDAFTLEEAAQVFFTLYNVRPLIMINVLEPTRHFKAKSQTLSTGSSSLTITGPIHLSTVRITSGTGDDLQTLVEGEDYELTQDGLTVTIELLSRTKITGEQIEVSWRESDGSAVTNNDIIDGLATLERVYPRLGMVPGTLIAPKYSANPEVALAMAARARLINDTFRTIALADIVEPLSEVYEYKSRNSLSDEFLALSWGRVGLGTKRYWLSSHAAALMCLVDAENLQIPYESASNKGLRMSGAYLDEQVDLSKPEANLLNSFGVITSLNFAGMWRLWGSRMSTYPANDDPKDAWLPVRRMMNWLGNTLAINYFSRIDTPINKRQVESVIDEVNLFLNGLTSRGILLGGRIAFMEEDNTDLADGKIRFRIYFASPTPARSIRFVLSYDVSYFATLFS